MAEPIPYATASDRPIRIRRSSLARAHLIAAIFLNVLCMFWYLYVWLQIDISFLTGFLFLSLFASPLIALLTLPIAISRTLDDRQNNLKIRLRPLLLDWTVYLVGLSQIAFCFYVLLHARLG